MSCVAKGLSCFAAVAVLKECRCPLKLEGGDWKLAVGLVESALLQLFDTDLETLSTRGTTMSCAGLMLYSGDFVMRMRRKHTDTPLCIYPSIV